MAESYTLSDLAKMSGGESYTLNDLAKLAPTREQIAAQVNNDAISKGARDFAGQGSDALYGASQAVLNALGGFVRGAGSIGATLARPFESAQENEQRRAGIDRNMQAVGAQPDSLFYKGGKLGAEIAGTAPVGGVIGRGAAAVLPRVGVSAPVVDAVAQGLATGGFRVPGLSGAPALAARVGTGAVTGGASAGLVDPEQAGMGAIIGGALPPVTQVAGKAGELASDKAKDAARWLMGTAVKPTLAQHKSGDAAVAIETMLQNGISPNMKGVEKLQGLIDNADAKITQGIADSNAQVFMPHVADRLNDTRTTFLNQVAPNAGPHGFGDIDVINDVENSFLNHPQYPGPLISVQDAQKLKQGTYRILNGKYGEQGSAMTEAQKALARGLKEEIAQAVPGVSDANAELSKLLKTLGVTERRAFMAQNNNPMGLGLLSPTKAGLLAFLADRNAAIKALAARGLYSAADVSAPGLLTNPLMLPAVRQGLLATEASP